MSKTLRLVFPQWQGGNNPNYLFGSELLRHIVPQSNKAETIQITVDENTSKELLLENGVIGGNSLLKQLSEASKVLTEKQPEKVITLGGDCSISQAPFDYLHGNILTRWEFFGWMRIPICQPLMTVKKGTCMYWGIF